jgi:hypothetical protein
VETDLDDLQKLNKNIKATKTASNLVIKWATERVKSKTVGNALSSVAIPVSAVKIGFVWDFRQKQPPDKTFPKNTQQSAEFVAILASKICFFSFFAL